MDIVEKTKAQLAVRNAVIDIMAAVSAKHRVEQDKLDNLFKEMYESCPSRKAIYDPVNPDFISSHTCTEGRNAGNGCDFGLCPILWEDKD